MSDEIASATLQTSQKAIEVALELIKMLAPLAQKALSEVYHKSVDGINPVGGAISNIRSMGTVSVKNLVAEAQKAKDVMETQAKKALKDKVTSFCDSDDNDPRKIIQYIDKDNNILRYPAKGADSTINPIIDNFGTEEYASSDEPFGYFGKRRGQVEKNIIVIRAERNNLPSNRRLFLIRQSVEFRSNAVQLWSCRDDVDILVTSAAESLFGRYADVYESLVQAFFLLVGEETGAVSLSIHINHKNPVFARKFIRNVDCRGSFADPALVVIKRY